MTESIAERVGRMISINLSMLIHSFSKDKPDKVLEKAMDEIDGILNDVRSELGKISVNKYQTRKYLSEQRRTLLDLEKKVHTLVSGNELLPAEDLIAEQLDIEAKVPVLERALYEFSENEKRIEGYVRVLLAKKQEMKRVLEKVIEKECGFDEKKAKASSVLNGLAGFKAESDLLKTDSVLDALFEKEKHLSSSKPLKELDEWVRKTEIKDRLERIKKRLEGEP